jgi:hypothetical protein
MDETRGRLGMNGKRRKENGKSTMDWFPKKVL